jgi:hypothetical protein
LRWVALDLIVDAIQAIQAILAPAVMITGVALLLLTSNARHSSLVNRIRLLNDEERALRRKGDRLDDLDAARLRSIQRQINQLLPRLLYIRNGMLCQLLSAIFFVLTSFWIGLGYFSVSSALTQAIINATFMVGMLLVLLGVAFLAVEIYVSYRVILIETREHS